MELAVKERIVQNLVARLERIAPANGYATTIASVQRYGLDGVMLATVPTLYVSMGEDVVQTERQAFPYVLRRLELFISVITRPEIGEPRSGDELLNELGADVERCMLADGTHGGLAIKTSSPDWMECAVEDKLPHLALALRFAIDYRHDHRDPRRADA